MLKDGEKITYTFKNGQKYHKYYSDIRQVILNAKQLNYIQDIHAPILKKAQKLRF